MKKIVFSILLVVVLIVAVICINISDRNMKRNKSSEFNSQFEKYIGQTIYGTDVLSIINKAIDNNANTGVQKDAEGFYIEDDQNSVKVQITLLSSKDDGEVVEVTHQMETLEKAGLDKFIASFNLTEFKCTNADYNKEGRISKIYLKQLEI